MKKIIAALGIATLGMAAAGMAFAEPYSDWMTTKGAWEVTTIKVDPNHIDDYMTGLKKGWASEQEILKAHGVIDQYMVLVKLNSGAGANVQLIVHYPSLAMMEPDKARDQAIEKEALAKTSKEALDATVAGYDKYRTFVSDDIWTTVEFPK
jgi:hypothetical protein